MSRAIVRALRIDAPRAERNEIYRMARAGTLNDEPARPLVREIDLAGSRLGTD